MTTTALRLSLLAPLLLSTLMGPRVEAQANDMFPSKEAALQRAKQLNCAGAFAMGSEWMPCQNFDAYQKAIQKRS